MTRPNDAMRALREARGMNRTRLAEAAGVHRLTIQRLEEGRNKPDFRTLEKIARALKVPVVALMPAEEGGGR